MKIKLLLLRFKKLFDILLSKVKIYYQKATSKKEEENTEIPMPFVGTEGNGNGEQPTPNTEKFYKKRKRLKQKNVRGWIIVGATIFMTLFTALLFFIASSQNKVTWDALDFQKRTYSIDSLRQEIKDDLFIKSQNARDTFARESFVMENRAYVVIDSIIFPKEFNFNGDSTTITFRIKNVGRTPSQYTQLFHWSSYHKNVIEQTFIEIYKEVMANKIGGFVIGNNDFLKLPDTLFKRFTVEDYIYLSKDNLIYIGGIIGYFDIFKIHRMTYFCFQYSHHKGEIAPYKGYNNIDYYEKTKNNN